MQPDHLLVSRTIDERRGRIAELMTERQYRAYPELAARYGAQGRERCMEDAIYHLSYLSEAVASTSPGLFADYIAWAKAMLAGRGIPANDLETNLRFMRDSLMEELPADHGAIAASYIDSGMAQFPALPEEPPGSMQDESPLAGLAGQYLDALLRGARHDASRLVMDAVAGGAAIRDIYLEVFQRSQHEIGRLWQLNRISVAQEHYCTAATQLIMSQLYPQIFSTERNGRVMVAACIGGDLHEIGVRMISDFFEMDGWDTFYLGASTPLRSIVQTVIDRGAHLLAVSATMTFHVRGVKELIAAIRSNPACRNVKILVGGYPFNAAPDLWRQTGADAYARSAAEAVSTGNELMEQKPL